VGPRCGIPETLSTTHGLSCRRKTRHTTHLEGFPSKVTILRDHHPLQGQVLEVFSWTHRHGALHLTLVLPDGSRSLIPAAWTDLNSSNLPTLPAENTSHSSTAVGTVSHLLHTRKVVDYLLQRLDASAQLPETPSKEERQRASTTDLLARNAGPISRSRNLATTRSRNKKTYSLHALQADQQGNPSTDTDANKGDQP
jgi:hypothetical protein